MKERRKELGNSHIRRADPLCYWYLIDDNQLSYSHVSKVVRN